MTGNSTENLWYIARDGQQHGPISDTEMRLFVENGHLRPSDLLWRPGFTEWRPATTVFSDQAAATAPEPAPKAPETPAETASAGQEMRKTSPSKEAGGGAQRAEDKPTGTAAAVRTSEIGAAAPVAMARPAPSAQAPSPSPGRANSQASASAGPSAGRPMAMSGPGPRDTGPAAPKAPAQQVSPSNPGAAMSLGAQSKAAPYVPVTSRADATPARTGRGRKLAMATVLLAMIVGSFAYVVSHKDDIIALMGSGKPQGEVPVIKAEPAPQMKAQQETAALQRPAQSEQPSSPARQSAEPTQSPPVTNAPADQAAASESIITPTATPPIEDASSAVDAYYQQSKLWQYMKRAYPDWYSERISAAAALVSGAAPARDATKSMVEGLVALRRQNANDALQADTGMLKAIATAFLNNLQSLAEKGPDICYGFISQGETSPKSIDLFHKPQSTPELEGQALTIFEAIAAGKAAPTQHERPKKGDYDVLAAELGKLGWSQADLQLFADPKALSNAPPARVCAMVRDWFKAHIAISDSAVQERLLFETLRPVVAG